MTTRAWSGVIVVEDTQTGDGRTIAAGAIEWADLPLPLAWLRDGDQHVDMIQVGPQIGTIDTIERVGKDIIGTGSIDTDNPDGAEVVRRMDSGTAPHGSGYFISIDPDDWEVEVVLPEGAEDDDSEMVASIVASGTGPLPVFRAAAGDPDPGEGGGPDGDTLLETAADEIIERMTRLRIRGATLCSVSAFAEAFIELAPGEAATTDATVATGPIRTVRFSPKFGRPLEPVVRTQPVTVVTAHAIPAPPRSHFSDPELTELQRWTTIDEDGRVYGHLAGWGECHIGYPDECITPERLMEGGLAYAMPGYVVCSDGSTVGTMPLTIKNGHAAGHLNARGAQAHYDDPDAAPGHAALGMDSFGVWFSGAIKSDARPEDIYTLRAHGVSGDWREIGGVHRLIGACCINIGGFPKVMARVASGRIMALVAAGGRPLPDPTLGLADCGCGCTDDERSYDMERRLARIEDVTRDAVLASIDARVRG